MTTEYNFKVNNANKLPVTPKILRASELIKRKPWKASINIWAFGYLVYLCISNSILPSNPCTDI